EEEDPRAVCGFDRVGAGCERLTGTAVRPAPDHPVVTAAEDGASVAAPGDDADRFCERLLLAGRQVADAGGRGALHPLRVGEALAVGIDHRAGDAAPAPAVDHRLGA